MESADHDCDHESYRISLTLVLILNFSTLNLAHSFHGSLQAIQASMSIGLDHV